MTSPTGTSETTLNSAGKVVESKVNSKGVSYKYYPTGQISKAIPEGGPAVEFGYDLLGNRTVLKDPDTGTVTSEYNGFGQILKNTHKIHTGSGDSITSYKYFASGLIEDVNVHGKITKYKYDSKNRIEKIEIAGEHEQSFMYDSNNRPIKMTEIIDGNKTYDFKTEYDAYGRVKKEIYPSGFYISNEYDENGFLINVTDSKDQKIWEAVEANAKGQLTRYRQGGHETFVDYHDIWGLPNTIVSGDNINMAYYYTEKGNLDYREDRSTSGITQKEKFYYDSANRLETYDISLNGTLKQSNTIQYDPLTGGINYKTDVGFKMEYGQNTPFHSLSVVQGLPESAKAPQAITYSNINKVKSITQGDKQHQITYGVNQQRIKGLFKTGSTTTLTKYYLGKYEEEVVSGNTRKLHYIYGGNGLAAIMEYKNGQENLYYTFSDYQGNLLAVTNTAGTERYAYDPWGARRNPDDWTQPDTRSSLLFSRGYTMHEHLDDFGLINMNGRVYDPLMAQFFSPDPYIQSPGNWYNYNRYAYGLNNPLLYNDPSGYFIKKFGRWLEEKFDDLGDWMVKHNISVGVGVNMTPGGGPMTYTADINGQQVFNSANGNQYDPAVNVYRGLSDAMLSQGIVDGNIAANWGGTKGWFDKFNFIAGVKATGASAFLDSQLNSLSMLRPIVDNSGATVYQGSSKWLSTFKASKVVKGFGFGLTGLGIGYDYLYGVPRYNQGIRDEWSVNPFKADLNTGVALYSLFVNPFLGIGYFGIDAFYPGGWPSALQDQDRLILKTQRTLGPTWNPYRGPQGPLN
ncbi:RHS repeat-associated core domain-containing protein [Geofilum rubicundum]|uniref:Rhs family protein n=1 Tax=Geofilum rubicundum JCM 15548 TaxID=1236989 RepID=A0A0E9LUB9_9BACT|nr:RHS repeat-associated core domain-containing protein [Geofilum rubicundum]GAO29182.1 Rhs family protein [Geofilum rubicundum JCM 15548]